MPDVCRRAGTHSQCTKLSAGQHCFISFELLDKDGQRVKPQTQPSSYTAGSDIITAVALAEEGRELIFPLSNGTSPYLTDKMDRMRLVVDVDGAEQTLEYRL